MPREIGRRRRSTRRKGKAPKEKVVVVPVTQVRYSSPGPSRVDHFDALRYGGEFRSEESSDDSDGMPQWMSILLVVVIIIMSVGAITAVLVFPAKRPPANNANSDNVNIEANR